jgi:murein DD-endopeptidase MepM/ murein hydrolase activator NlpD
LRKQRLGRGSGSAGLRVAIVLVAAAALAFGARGLLRRGPAPVVTLATDHPAIGEATKVVAHFSEPEAGLGTIRLELSQGARTVVLGEEKFARTSTFALLPGHLTGSAEITATVGRSKQAWLAEGTATLRATADRLGGALRSHPAVVVEKRLSVLLRPPELEILSQHHYVRQGGSGAVVFRVGPTAVRSGVMAGDVETLSYPRPGGGPGERFALFGVPWQLDDPAQVKVFAEDGAGNRSQLPFIDSLRKAPPQSGTIEIDDAFLARVVPAISSRTAGLDSSGSLLEQYLRINSELRKVDLARIAEIAHDSQERFLWSGPFVQMPETAKLANFAERRTYVYKGRVVDHEVHLGFDLASHVHAAVPAANSGRVVFAGWLGIYGNAVILDHGYGLMSLYGHLSEIRVKPGALVAKGQRLGTSGATGLAGGDHLHLELFLQGHSVNPIEWLDGHWIRNNLGSKLHVPMD